MWQIVAGGSQGAASICRIVQAPLSPYTASSMGTYVHSIRVRATNKQNCIDPTHKDCFERRYIVLLPVSIAINALILFVILKIWG